MQKKTITNFDVQLDISGEVSPRPIAAQGFKCSSCGHFSEKLWRGERANLVIPHEVCTLCYLAGHLDSPTAAHGRLCWLPDIPMNDVHHIQRRSLIAQRAGTRTQRKEGKNVWVWLMRHSHEIEIAWGTSNAGEFAVAMSRLAPKKRQSLRLRLNGCALVLPADVFDDMSLLLPKHKKAEAALLSISWNTYTRSDLYVKCPSPLD